VIRSALRRIAVILVVLVGGTAAVSAALGGLSGRSVLHSLAVGYYVVGTAVLVGSFVLGLRGPVRSRPLDDPSGQQPSMTGWGGVFLPRTIRRTTPEERLTAKQGSVGLFLLGILLVAIGAMIDPSRRVF
jgi:hypothetical protein